MREFLAVMNESDPSKRLGRSRFIELKFRVYPPYWFFRANAAMNAGNDEECRKCYAKFNEVWRPVLNYDPYKLEAVKQRIRELAKMGVPEGETVNEIRGLAETLRDYAPPYDWGSNLFAGIVYFALGDKDEAINCVEYGNVASGRETEISGVILAQMKRGEIDVAKLPEELRGLFGKKYNETQGQKITGIQADSNFYERADLRVLRGKNIGVTIWAWNAYWVGCMTALHDILTEVGAKFTVVACDSNSATQISHIENFIAAGADLIMVQTLNAKAVEYACAEARNFDIKIICWDNNTIRKYADSNPHVTARVIADLMAIIATN